MILDPVQRSLPQFCSGLIHVFPELNLIEFLSSKPFGELSSLQMERAHPATPAFLAKQSRFPGRMESSLRSERCPARSASIKLRQPSPQAHRPECEVA